MHYLPLCPRYMGIPSTNHKNGRSSKQPVQSLLNASGVKLTYGWVLKELEQLQNYLLGYKIIVYDGLGSERFIFIGNFISNKKLFLLYDGRTTKLLQTSRPLWQKGICVMGMTICTNLHTSVTQFAPMYGDTTLIWRSVNVLWYILQVVPEWKIL